MPSKPIVVLALPPATSEKMFRPADLDRLKSVATVVGPVPAQPREPFVDALKGADVAITGWGSPPFNEALLAGVPKLRLMSHSAGSVKGLATEAVYDRGIKVTTSANSNAIPVAQFTVAMMVSLLKQIPFIAAAHTAGRGAEVSERRNACRELMDMNVGLIGASRVGREVIKLLSVYPNLTIKVYDPYLPPEAAKEMGVQLVSLDEACACEVVSLHAPQIPETRHMMNARTLALMPDHAVFVNTSRGALVDETAFIAEMRRRPIYAALDVTDPEPPPADSPLRSLPNIVLTPHIAGAMAQGCFDMGRNAIDQAIRFFAGQPLTSEVTRAMLPTQA